MPCHFRDLKRVSEEAGCTVEEPSKGSHWKVRKDGKMYPIPVHNGLKTEIGNHYISGVERALGLTDLKTKL